MLEGTEIAASKIYHNHSWKVYKRILQLPGRPEPRAILAHRLVGNCNAVVQCFGIQSQQGCSEGRRWQKWSTRESQLILSK